MVINWIIKVWEMQALLVAIIMVIDYETDGDYDFQIDYFWNLLESWM